MSSSPSDRFPTVIPLTRRRPLSARSLPAGVGPGHSDLRLPRRPRAPDAGRRLEEIVALEARRAQDRGLRTR
jgi:hypothetical protein